MSPTPCVAVRHVGLLRAQLAAAKPARASDHWGRGALSPHALCQVSPELVFKRTKLKVKI